MSKNKKIFIHLHLGSRFTSKLVRQISFQNKIEVFQNKIEV